MLIILSLSLANHSVREGIVFDRVHSQSVLLHILGLNHLDTKEVSQVNDIWLEAWVIDLANRYKGQLTLLDRLLGKLFAAR